MNAKYKSPRKSIPVRAEKAVLAKSRRRCMLCFGLRNDRTEKRGQIAHLDGNRNNNAESNLAFLCLDHHSQFDSKTKQHKNYTISEVKEHRRQLYKALRQTSRRSSRRAQPPHLVASKPKQVNGSTKITNSSVASGNNISQTINSPTVNLSLPAPTGVRGSQRYDEWRDLIDEIHESIVRMGYAFMPLVPIKPGDDRNDYQAGIRRGNRVLGNRILIADTVQKSDLKKDWDELVRYAHSGRGPRDRWEHGSPTMGGFDTKAREFQEKLMRIARQDMEVYSVASEEGQRGARPLVVPLRYGAAPMSAGKHMMGYYGLIVANHGEPAYDVSVLSHEIPIGTSKLRLEGSRPTLTKADGDAFFRAGIQESPGKAIFGNGLFDEMREHHVAEITVILAYKDADNRWYNTIGKIERNVSEPGGLSVRYIRQDESKQSNPEFEQEEKRRKEADSVVLSIKTNSGHQRNYTIQIKNHSKEFDISVKRIALWSDGQRVSEPVFRPKVNAHCWDVAADRQLPFNFDAGEIVAKRLWLIKGAPSMEAYHDTNLLLGHFRTTVRVEVLYEVLGIEKQYEETRTVQVDPINNVTTGM